MDVVSSTWFSEMEMEEYNIFDQLDFISDHDVLEEKNMRQSLSSESNSSYSAITVNNNNNNNQSNDTTSGTDSVVRNSHESFEINIMRPSKQLKTTSSVQYHSSNKPSNYYNPTHYNNNNNNNSSSRILSFENPNKASNINLIVKPKKEEVSEEIKCFKHKDSMIKSDHDHHHHRHDDHHYAPKVVNKRSYSSMIRTPSHAQDHIMAERKRREKLSQQFIALSAIVPGLKKMDKASVLGDAIKYLKELKERVETLEDQTKKRTVESVVLVRKSQLVLSTTDDDTSSSNESSDDGTVPEESLQYPEIEARVSDKDVLIRIHCHKRDKGLIAKILTEVEKLHLSIVNSNVMPFGNSTLDITIIAQMENEFNMKVKDLVKNLRLALLKVLM